jgi:segregation and condensation protein A
VLDREKIFTMEEALGRLRGLIGYAGDWTDILSYLPNGWEVDPAKRRSATASTFAASLELAKEGKIEMRQGDVFSPIQIRKKDR